VWGRTKKSVADLQIKYQKPITYVLAFLTISPLPEHHNILAPTNMLVASRFQVPGNVRDCPWASGLGYEPSRRQTEVQNHILSTVEEFRGMASGRLVTAQKYLTIGTIQHGAGELEDAEPGVCS
jgi:hypothetical protein